MAVDVGLTIVSQTPSQEYIGGTNTRNVIVVGFTTHGHNVYAEVRIPAKGYSAQLARAAALGPTQIIETLFTIAGVSGVIWGQAVNPSGLLVDQVSIIVESDSGDSGAQLGPIDVSALGPQLHTPQIKALVEQLNEAEV